MKLTDTDFLQILKRDLGPEIAATREAERLATAKKLAKERVAALADFDREFPKLEQIEEGKLAAFHELSKKLEHARQEAHAAHVARVSRPGASREDVLLDAICLDDDPPTSEKQIRRIIMNLMDKLGT